MKRRRIFQLLAVAATVAAALLLWPPGLTEPAYQGKSLTQWIREANDVGIFEQTDETKAAMEAIGTNGVPFLLKEFTRPISHSHDRLYKWINGLSLPGIYLWTDEERMAIAGRGLMLLETNALPAFPILMGYLADAERGPYVRDVCYFAGDGALLHLTAQLGSTNLQITTEVVATLSLMTSTSARALEALKAALNHSTTCLMPTGAQSNWNRLPERQNIVNGAQTP
jgi:hypothetical protein